ncbi:hypothetical protein MNBD_IGNAVI01-2169 [hydrothermal vent metagenome]|uniref:Uncharacterized protein n=1 Tax=hydrothermal vent metagenome TaxID=652676 RepID=A0A3B1CMD0_9ZZZZ
MSNIIQKKSNRRKFFATAGKSSLGLMLMSSFPMNIFSKNTKVIKLKEVHPHPQAVKRDNKTK